MLLAELFPAIKVLPRADKLRLMRFLVIDLALEESVPLLTVDAEFLYGRRCAPSRLRIRCHGC